jgi:hypothetical protein
MHLDVFPLGWLLIGVAAFVLLGVIVWGVVSHFSN